MNARDELADVFTGHTVGFGGFPKKLMRGHAQEIAERILAAGYSKPRTITTVAELDALPAKSAIMDSSGTPWVGDGDKVEPWASVCEDPYGGPVWADSRDIALPATVLYEPTP